MCLYIAYFNLIGLTNRLMGLQQITTNKIKSITKIIIKIYYSQHSLSSWWMSIYHRQLQNNSLKAIVQPISWKIYKVPDITLRPEVEGETRGDNVETSVDLEKEGNVGVDVSIRKYIVFTRKKTISELTHILFS